MKKAIFILVVVSIFAAFNYSCSKEEQKFNTSEKEYFNEDLIPQILSFQKYNFISPTKKPIIIVTWDEWGRAALDCDGWGLCNAVWFPQFQENKSASSDSGAYSTQLEFDNIQEKYYIDVLLSEIIPSDIPIDLYPLRIDESFTLNTEQEIGQNITFEEGEYPFDEMLGSHGGFRIYLN